MSLKVCLLQATEVTAVGKVTRAGFVVGRSGRHEAGPRLQGPPLGCETKGIREEAKGEGRRRGRGGSGENRRRRGIGEGEHGLIGGGADAGFI